MNPISFLFQSDLPLATATLACCLALLYGGLNAAQAGRVRRSCVMAWVGFVALAGCLVMTFKARYPGLETAPRLAQWQLGATLAAAALLLRVSLLRLAELENAGAAGEDRVAATLARGIRLHLVAAALLLAGAAGLAAMA
ncbi:hypothetical protein [Pseudomonas sp. RIT-PI-S]|uniref:hypothetical protein n=1 Tax=Pseudomonas sp. RIT-PI-S TaxID=3035295 RepID=UPI0021D8E4F5|nr:hypothetical protein [Pseudomonas sp. RIT-PI-S]